MRETLEGVGLLAMRLCLVQDLGGGREDLYEKKLNKKFGDDELGRGGFDCFEYWVFGRVKIPTQKSTGSFTAISPHVFTLEPTAVKFGAVMYLPPPKCGRFVNWFIFFCVKKAVTQ